MLPISASAQEKKQVSANLFYEIADGLWKRVRYRLNLDDNSILQVDPEKNKVKIGGKYEIPIPKKEGESDSTATGGKTEGS